MTVETIQHSKHTLKGTSGNMNTMVSVLAVRSLDCVVEVVC